MQMWNNRLYYPTFMMKKHHILVIDRIFGFVYSRTPIYGRRRSAHLSPVNRGCPKIGVFNLCNKFSCQTELFIANIGSFRFCCNYTFNCSIFYGSLTEITIHFASSSSQSCCNLVFSYLEGEILC